MGQSFIGCHGSLSFGFQWAMLESVLAIPGYILSIPWSKRTLLTKAALGCKTGMASTGSASATRLFVVLR